MAAWPRSNQRLGVPRRLFPLEPEAQAIRIRQTETYPLTDLAFLEDPYSVYRRMREHDPVYWSEELGRRVLTRYDVLAAARRELEVALGRLPRLKRLVGVTPGRFRTPARIA